MAQRGDLHVALTRERIDERALIERVTTPESGAIVHFLGVVRNEHHGRPVLRLEYDAYEAMAISEMQSLIEGIVRDHDANAAACEHRLGTLEVGEASIGIALAFGHRKPAFDALRDAMDRFKADVPIWKKEHFADGTTEWVHQSA